MKFPQTLPLLSTLCGVMLCAAPGLAESPHEDPKAWWSVQPITRPAVPPVDSAGGDTNHNPIDAFVAAKLAEKKLALSPEADRRTSRRWTVPGCRRCTSPAAARP